MAARLGPLGRVDELKVIVLSSGAVPALGTTCLFGQVVRNVNNNFVWIEQERALNQQRSLIMQNMVPPFG
ncbi:MAG: hypothetical protein NVS4B8_00550 [Herpetosiphon sp.]